MPLTGPLPKRQVVVAGADAGTSASMARSRPTWTRRYGRLPASRPSPDTTSAARRPTKLADDAADQGPERDGPEPEEAEHARHTRAETVGREDLADGHLVDVVDRPLTHAGSVQGTV